MPFNFENTRDAAEANIIILENNNWDVGKLLSQQSRTVMHPGTEFRPVEQLKKLLGQHKDWKKIKDIITKGAAYGFDVKKDYKEETRIADLHSSIKRGNNKSALDPTHKEFIQKNYNKEVKKGWMLPIPKEAVHKIKGAGLIPIGIAKQFTINKEGKRVQKKQLTHDCSNVQESGNSVNNTVDRDLLEECIYKFCLLRLLHHTQLLCIQNPNTRILIK